MTHRETCYELRRLRARLEDGRISLEEWAAGVIALMETYRK